MASTDIYGNLRLKELIRETLEKDGRVKNCRKFQGNKALQIQLYDGDNYNLNVTKLGKTRNIKKSP